jgi:uncharacterized membrane protein YobD (UPF0266 family)
LASAFAYSQEFLIRYLLQAMMIIIIYQTWIRPEKIIKAFHKMLASNGKTKFYVRLLPMFINLNSNGFMILDTGMQ